MTRSWPHSSTPNSWLTWLTGLAGGLAACGVVKRRRKRK
ncbi:MAG TPA: hypothetical protein DEP80_03840 [Anaerolineae bacterium]|nr:hypothetical protein [Anaerolineae bacterium]HCC78722.1 hypothetical protein [Anaerolineae bacterium]HCM96559.1 hypothetical protein [Anaerolineae bacterium]